MKHVSMAFDNRSRRMRIYKTTLDALDRPEQFFVTISKDRLRLLIVPAKPEYMLEYGACPEDVLTVPGKLYEQARPYEHYAGGLIEILGKNLGWNLPGLYKIHGAMAGDIAVFDMANCEVCF